LGARALHAHPGDDRQRHQARHQRAAEFCLLAVGRIDVQRMEIQREQRLPGVVRLRDRPPRPVLHHGADLHVVEIEAARLPPPPLGDLLECRDLIHPSPQAPASTASFSRIFCSSASSLRAADTIGGPIMSPSTTTISPPCSSVARTIFRARSTAFGSGAYPALMSATWRGCTATRPTKPIARDFRVSSRSPSWFCSSK